MIEERIITCINLFNSCNELEKFFDKLIELSKRMQYLSDDEINKILKYTTKDTFTDEEKKTEWYKILEESKNINKPSSDDFQKMIISLSALLISLNKESIIEKDSNKNLSILVDTPSYKEILNHFCIKKDNKYYIDDSIKSMVDFKKHDLICDSYDGNFDLILCRNVVIYFNNDIKKVIYQKFADSLKKGGLLFIGATESIYNYRECGFEKVSTFVYRKI